jgi:hypothetical protein
VLEVPRNPGDDDVLALVPQEEAPSRETSAPLEFSTAAADEDGTTRWELGASFDDVLRRS